MEVSKERLKLIVAEDIMLRAPLWALLILSIWGAISFVMIWTLLNVIKPSIDNRLIKKKESTSINNNKINQAYFTLKQDYTTTLDSKFIGLYND